MMPVEGEAEEKSGLCEIKKCTPGRIGVGLGKVRGRGNRRKEEYIEVCCSKGKTTYQDLHLVLIQSFLLGKKQWTPVVVANYDLSGMVLPTVKVQGEDGFCVVVGMDSAGKGRYDVESVTSRSCGCNSMPHELYNPPYLMCKEAFDQTRVIFSLHLMRSTLGALLSVRIDIRSLQSFEPDEFIRYYQKNHLYLAHTAKKIQKSELHRFKQTLSGEPLFPFSAPHLDEELLEDFENHDGFQGWNHLRLERLLSHTDRVYFNTQSDTFIVGPLQPKPSRV